jgi:adenylate cyclase class 1
VRVLCDDLEFSSLEHGPEVFARVAEHVLGLRRSAEPYPVYVTDVDLSALEEPGGPRAPVPTVRYLRYKAEVEGRLNRALAEREEPLRRSSGV